MLLINSFPFKIPTPVTVKVPKLREQKEAHHIPSYIYFGFLVFILLYFPYIGTLTAIGKETGRKSWYLFETIYTTSLAWIAAFLIYTIGNFMQ